MGPRAVRIVLREIGGFDVFAEYPTDTLVADHLTFDEMLGHVACLLMPERVKAGEGLFSMLHARDINKRDRLATDFAAACAERNALPEGTPEHDVVQARVTAIADQIRALRVGRTPQAAADAPKDERLPGIEP